MDSAAGGVSEGASEAARAGAHMARQLYAQGVSALTNAASAARGADADLGDGPFGRALKQTWRPAGQLVQSYEEIQQFQSSVTSGLGEAIDTSKDHYRLRFEAALTDRCASGDALLQAHDANIRLWGKHQDMYESAAAAAGQALVHIKGLQGRIDGLAQAGEEEFNNAVRRRDPITAMDVWTRYNGQAEESTTEATQKATGAIRAADFTIPLDKEPGEPGPDKQQTEPGGDGKQSDPTKAGGDGDKDVTATPDGSQTATPPAGPNATPAASTTPDGTQTGVNPAGSSQGGANQTPVSSPVMPQSLSGAMGRVASGGGGSGGGGSAMSGLGSGLNPGSVGSGLNPGSGMSNLGSSMSTSPASSLPAAPPAAPSAPSSMANAGSSFQSGLASGMGATAPPVAQQPIAPQQAVSAQQPLTGVPPAGSGPAGVPVAPHGVPDGGGGPVQGGSGTGGGPMMPPPVMSGGGPLAPYSAPGAGAPGAGGVPTTPAAGGQASSGGAASGGGAGAGGLAAPGPLVAGGSGSGGAMGSMAASASEVGVDMLLAQRVLGGLVRGCEFWPAPIAWAVGVVKTPVGSQVVVANSVGGGSYVPSTVFLPSTARLAVVDPALPFGWARRWMGCQKPSKILVDHFEQLSRRVAGASISAMVTTELWPVEPAGVGEFLGVQHRQALGLLSVAPVLDGAHQHRLTALDPVLAQRVSAVDVGGNVSAWAAAQLTAAVIQAAVQPDATGEKLVTDDEVSVLAAVHRGAADAAAWQAYDQVADQRHDGALVAPDSHAPLDHDGSELTESLTLWYRHYYQCGRIVEMVRAWKSSPPPLAEIAYCGVQAGFGSVVTAMVGAIEQQLRGRSA